MHSIDESHYMAKLIGFTLFARERLYQGETNPKSDMHISPSKLTAAYQVIRSQTHWVEVNGSI
jgi:hypothetical protein